MRRLALPRAVPVVSLALILLSARNGALASVAAADAAVDRAFQDFWAATDANAAAKRIDPVLKSGVSFEDALARLRRGREYSASPPRGLLRGNHRTFNGVDHAYSFNVPQGYDPSHSIQVRFQLHGGVGRPDPAERGPAGVNRIAGT